MIWNDKEINKIVVKNSEGEILAEITDQIIVYQEIKKYKCDEYQEY